MTNGKFIKVQKRYEWIRRNECYWKKWIFDDMLNGGYNVEWIDIYQSICEFNFEVYQKDYKEMSNVTND